MVKSTLFNGNRGQEKGYVGNELPANGLNVLLFKSDSWAKHIMGFLRVDCDAPFYGCSREENEKMSHPTMGYSHAC